ncbi:MAG: IS630 transposase-related protein [Actinobacteria bacterium]|nr:IS630 transposase-related protein [Actinomycetota bacterium]
MEAYFEDLIKKIVDAAERRGMGQSEAARLFSVSLSSVKRYVRKSRQGRSLSPGKAPGKRPKMDERARKLLEADLKERPFVTLKGRCKYLRAVAAVEVSRSVVCRTIRRMDSTRKKGWQPPVVSETNGSEPPPGE